jgi:Lar family restriction alleviation protein
MNVIELLLNCALALSALQLKSCPFCGEKANAIEMRKNIGYVECEYCSIRTPVSLLEAAVKAWNTRNLS